MKLKGISRFEQHADKIVFAIFALFLVFVLVMQVGLLGGAPTVDVNGKKAPIDRASEEVKLLADAKRARLESDRVDERIPAQLPSALAKYEEALASTNGLPQRLEQPIGLAAIRGVGSASPINDTIEDSGEFHALMPPAPSRPLVELYEGAIDPIAVAEIGESLASLLPPQQPYDVRSVTVLSTFDAARLRALLRGEEGGAPIPASFWQGRVELLDVEFLRQERPIGGEWGKETLLPQLPGRSTLRDRLAAGDIEPIALRSLLDAERGGRQAIRRPAMYPVVAGEPWTWPQVEDVGASQAQTEIRTKSRRLAELRSEIQRLQREIERTPTAPPRDGTGTGPRRDREQMQRRLQDLQTQERALIEELTALGVNPDDPSASAAARPQQFDEPLASLTEPATETVTLWTHDLTAKPGHEYRYRVRVVVTNPFFGQADRLRDEQRDLANGVAVRSAESEWSDPVLLEPETVFFVRSANDAGQDPVANRSRATVEIYRFFYGYWRKAAASVFPGDPIAASTEEMPALETWRVHRDEQGNWIAADPQPVERVRTLGTDLYLIDVTALTGGDPHAAVAYLGDAKGAVVRRRPESSGEAAARRERLETSARLGQQVGTTTPSGDGAGTGDRRTPPPFPPPQPPRGPSNPPGERERN